MHIRSAFSHISLAYDAARSPGEPLFVLGRPGGSSLPQRGGGQHVFIPRQVELSLRCRWQSQHQVAVTDLLPCRSLPCLRLALYVPHESLDDLASSHARGVDDDVAQPRTHHPRLLLTERDVLDSHSVRHQLYQPGHECMSVVHADANRLDVGGDFGRVISAISLNNAAQGDKVVGR